jgi:V-type H+-transporting ATPase subunit A
LIDIFYFLFLNYLFFNYFFRFLVIIVKSLQGIFLNELLKIGPKELLGEVIQIDGDLITIFMFEDAIGLQIGDCVMRTHKPFSVELGPGIMSQFFDGLQRPLEKIYSKLNDEKIFLPKGINVSPLERNKEWHFKPIRKVGDHVFGGDIFGFIQETELICHNSMIPPKEKGTIKFIAQEGNYTILDIVLEIEFEFKSQKITLLQNWPIREPRPVKERLRSNSPLFFGHRVLDGLFPMSLGGKCLIPGAYGCGKGLLSFTFAKYSNTDCLFFVHCGERSNELSEMIMELPEITTNVVNSYGQTNSYSLMSKCTTVSNTSNMPIGAIEASIFVGISLAEYYRDMGYNVGLMADSTSRFF